MDFQNIEEIENKIKEIEKHINEKLKNYKNYNRIMLLGLTGSGKSSVARYLAREKVQIGLKENKISTCLIGAGIISGFRAGTDIPVIYVDDENKVLYCDCPGFEDTGGMNKEIINTFSDDFLINSSEHDIYVKILLVVSAYEFETRRGGVVLETFKRLEKMFPNTEQIRDSIGFIITQGNDDKKGTDYFISLAEKACPELKAWCDYFMRRKNHVFLFPQAKKEDVGKQYKFDDYDRLMEFLTRDFIKNPDHEITLGSSSKTQLNLIRSKHLQAINEIVKDLFIKINSKYRESNNSETIGLWLNIMHSLMDQKISKISDLRTNIEKYVPDCEEYDEYFNKLNEYEAIDAFIDRIYDVDTITTSLQDIFRSITHSALKELEKVKIITENSEIQEKLIKEKEKMIERYQDDLQDQKDKIDKMKSDFEEEQKKYNEKERENNLKLIQMNKEIAQQQQIYENKQKEYNEQIDQMNNKISEQQRIIDEKTREHKEKLDQVLNDLQNQQMINDEMKRECSARIEQIEQMKKEFYNQKNIDSVQLKEYKELIDSLVDKVEKQDNIINNLRNAPPVVIESGSDCLLI